MLVAAVQVPSIPLIPFNSILMIVPVKSDLALSHHPMIVARLEPQALGRCAPEDLADLLAPKSVEVCLVDWVDHVPVIVQYPSLHWVDLKEAAECGDVGACTHLDGRDGGGVLVGALVLSEPAVVQLDGVGVGGGVVGVMVPRAPDFVGSRW